MLTLWFTTMTICIHAEVSVLFLPMIVVEKVLCFCKILQLAHWLPCKPWWQTLIRPTFFATVVCRF